MHSFSLFPTVDVTSCLKSLPPRVSQDDELYPRIRRQFNPFFFKFSLFYYSNRNETDWQGVCWYD